MDVADAGRTSFHVSGEYDAVGIGVGVGDVERACRQAQARSDARQPVRVGEGRVAEILRELVAAPLGSGEIVFGGCGRGDERADQAHGEHEALRQAQGVTLHRRVGSSIGLPCGVARAAESHSSTRRSSS